MKHDFSEYDLSKKEGDKIKEVIGKVIDIIVIWTGGKPTFDKK